MKHILELIFIFGVVLCCMSCLGKNHGIKLSSDNVLFEWTESETIVDSPKSSFTVTNIIEEQSGDLILPYDEEGKYFKGEWLSVTQVSVNTVLISVSENTSGNERKGIISLRSRNSFESISVRQKGNTKY